jgi:lipid-binding SYLF domain-containing protein
MKRNTLSATLLSLVGLLWMTAPPAWAWNESNTTIVADRADRAADVLKDLVGSPDSGIPKELLENAQGIAVIPHVVHAGFWIGGRWGKGMMAVREKNGMWSAPVFITLTGGSFGPQMGAEATDLVLVFNNRKGINALLNSKLKLGADASVAAGPVGRSAGAGVDLKLESSVYSYSRSKGLFAGVALDGAIISVDNHVDHRIYGPGFSAKNILFGRKVVARWMTAPFVRALERYSPSTTQSAEARNTHDRSRAMTPSSY